MSVASAALEGELLIHETVVAVEMPLQHLAIGEEAEKANGRFGWQCSKLHRKTKRAVATFNSSFTLGC